MNYKEIIESRYNRDAWQQLLHDIFLSKVVFRAPYAGQTHQIIYLLTYKY